MHVFYLHSSATFGGASKSLIELFLVLRQMGIKGTVISPRGSACSAFKEMGFHVFPVSGLSQFDNTRFGFYRGVRWLILLREIFFLPVSLYAIASLRKERFDLIHVNEITLLPLAIITKWIFRIPVVVHIRSLQRKPGENWRTNLLNKWLGRYADAVVAIDETVAKSLPANLPITVVHNGLHVNNDNPAPERPGKSVVSIGFLGVLIPLKGIYELVEAMRILVIERGVAVECVIAGENARQLSGLKARVMKWFGFAHDVRAEVEALIARYGLQGNVRLLGFVADVRQLYPNIDILCFPSHLDAAGRPVFEAAFYGIPSVVVINDPPEDAVIDGVTGIAVKRPDPILIADALQSLAQSPVLRNEMGVRARVWAKNYFSIESNAQKLASIYRVVLEK